MADDFKLLGTSIIYKGYVVAELASEASVPATIMGDFTDWLKRAMKVTRHGLPQIARKSDL